jgi:hypothetical protein
MENSSNIIARMPKESGLLGHVVRSGEIQNIIDAKIDVRFDR